jgi:UDP-glucose 6-dehydrogenase
LRIAIIGSGYVGSYQGRTLPISDILWRAWDQDAAKIAALKGGEMPDL